MSQSSTLMGLGRIARGIKSRFGGLRPQRYFSLNGLDKRIEKYVDHDGGFFVELGANDGVDQSNTLYFERYRQWRGVLIEPVPHNYFKCKANRSPLNAFHCAACVSFDYTDPFVKILYSNLMTTAVGIDSDIGDAASHARLGSQFLSSDEEVITFGALARPLNDILIESGAPQTIDLLSLDVEGAELEVLKGVDHDRFKFKHILVECRDLPKMEGYLRDRGYELVERVSEHDYFFRLGAG